LTDSNIKTDSTRNPILTKLKQSKNRN